MQHASSQATIQQPLSWRRFLQVVAEALGRAFRTKHAQAPRVEPEAPAGHWSPGPDWERVPPSTPGGVGGWRNRKDGTYWTDWIAREREMLSLTVETISGQQVVLRYLTPLWVSAADTPSFL